MIASRFDCAVTVLGMHRSGTSALTGVLALGGLATPRTLLPSDSGNERGFWESPAVKTLNDQIFEALGDSWFGLSSIESSALAKPSFDWARDQAKAVIQQEYAGARSVVLKDPRICRLLPLWLTALQGVAERTICPIILRNPVEVARSLRARNDFDAELGYLLWARYMLDAEYFTRGCSRAIISYEALLGDWRSALASLQTAIDVPIKLESSAQQIDDFLSIGLRHHRVTDEATAKELRNAPLVEEVYRLLSSWAEGEGLSPKAEAALDRTRSELDAIGPLLSVVSERARAERKRLMASRAQSESMTKELERARQAQNNLEAFRLSLKSQTKAHNLLRENLTAATSSLTAALRERTSLEAMLSNALKVQDDLRAEVRQLSADVAKSITEAEAQKRDHVSLQRDHVSLQKDFEERLAAKSREVQTKCDELKDVKRKYRSTQHQLARDREKLRRTQLKVEEARRIIARHDQSFIGRADAFVRSFGRRSTRKVLRLFGLGDLRSRAQEAALLRSSTLFDDQWYLAKYSDVAAAGLDPARHYLDSGWREGRDPGSSFSTEGYLRSNPDVAQSGVNPLLHYIEFGYSEGRSVSEHAGSGHSVLAPRLNLEFGEAAECASFPIEHTSPVRWRRASRLDGTRADAIRIGETIVGYAPQEFAAAILGQFGHLAHLSGFADADNGAGIATESPPPAVQLVDAWHASGGLFRSRWRTEHPDSVVRAYQHDPKGNGTVSLVGESLLRSALDFVEVNPRNSLFPVLFVFSNVDGQILSAQTFAFPSLCRGGLHYPELLGLAVDDGLGADGINPLAYSERLGRHLLDKFGEAGRASVRNIRVDLTDADGSEPLFQSEMRDWLAGPLRVSVEPKPQAIDRPASEYLRTAITLGVRDGAGGGTLSLGSDMIPTIGTLVGKLDVDAKRSDGTVELLLTNSDPAQPTTLVRMVASQALDQSALSSAQAWPSFSLADGGASVAAIRMPIRPPNDTELLMPIGPDVLPHAPNGRSITWLIFVEDWGDEALAEAVQALSLQASIEPPTILIEGEPTASIQLALDRYFPGQHSSTVDVATAVENIQTPLVGYLGNEVILHDARTAHVLSNMLDDVAVATASCALVVTERSGKSWKSTIVDAGVVGALDGSLRPRAEPSFNARALWRSTFPTALPPRGLWVARTPAVIGWLQRAGPLSAQEGIHACTTMITASVRSMSSLGPPHLAPPTAADENIMRMQELFG